MGVFDRISNVAKGKASKAAGDYERANADAVYESAINNALERLDDHTKALAGLMAQRNKLAEALEEMERERDQASKALRGATEEGDDDTALVLLSHREELDQKRDATQREHDSVVLHVEETKQGLAQLRANIEALKNEQHTAMAQLEVAEAQIQVSDAMSGFGDSAADRGLDSVRSSIGMLEAQAHEGYLDEEGNSVRGRAAALGKKASEADARAQLARMKRELAAQRGESPAVDADPDEDGEKAEAPKVDPGPKRTL